MNLTFDVSGQRLTGHAVGPVVSDSVGYLTAGFTFSEDWADLDKWAHLENEKGEVYDVHLTNDKADARLNLTAGHWKMWLHGNEITNGATTVRATTTTVTFDVSQYGRVDEQPLPVIALSVAEQIAANTAYAVRLVESLNVDAEAMRTAADQAKATAEIAVNAASVAEDAWRSAELSALAAKAAKDSAEIEAQAARDAKNAIENLGVTAETLPAGSDATVEKQIDESGSVNLKFGIPAGGGNESAPVVTEAQTTIDRVNPLYANQFLGVLKSYYDNRKDASGDNIFAYGHNTAVDGYAGNQIDCSAYVALGLMGIPFDQSPYAGLASSPADKDDDGSETATGSGETDAGDSATNVLSVGAYAWAVDLKKYQREKDGSKAPIRTAAQMCEWLEGMGLGTEYSADFSNVQRGDIVFYAKKDGDNYRQPNRYKKVSHVAVVSSTFDNTGDTYGIGSQYPYKHTLFEVSTFGGIVLNTTLEKRTPEYIVSICRPPFGAVNHYTVSGGVANQQDSTDVNRMFNEGLCYLTSSITAGLPDGVANGIGLSLKVEKTYNKWGKPYSIVQTLYNTKTGDLWSRMQYCYPSYVESPSGWTAWKPNGGGASVEDVLAALPTWEGGSY